MDEFTILHLSDLHWSTSKAIDQKIVIDALVDDIQALSTDGVKPNLIIFSGDLVMAGDQADEFEQARVNFIEPVRQVTRGVPFVIVPGNHDIGRDTVRAAIGFVEKGLKDSLRSVGVVNKFIDLIQQRSQAAISALERLNNYDLHFPKFGTPTPISDSPLLKTYKIPHGAASVGVAAFNTAWRCTGEPNDSDRHFLLLGERVVDLALDDLKDCELRIAVFHHPLNWLADFDEVAVSSRLQSQFDLFACGHVHQPQPEFRATAQGGALVSQGGCIYENRDYFNGYQIVRLDAANEKAEFTVRTFFNRPRRKFDRALNIAEGGRVELPFIPRVTSSSPEVEAFLRATRSEIRHVAADQVNIIVAAQGLHFDPKEAFVCPPLTLSRNRAVDPNKGNTHQENELSVEQLLRAPDDFHIFGPRESGKSSLAHYMAVLIAEGVTDKPRIPAVIDFRQLQISEYGLRRAIATYFGVSRRGLNIEERLKVGDFGIIIDNFPRIVSNNVKQFAELKAKQRAVRWILLSDDGGISSEPQSKNMPDLNTRSVYIQTLPRKSIRELSRRWTNQIGLDGQKLDGQKAFTTVMRQLKNSHLPRTGYIVTLILWAIYQEKKFDRINEALLLTNVVDFLLGKADFTEAIQGTFDPISREITLQYIAKIVRNSDGIMTKNDLLKSLIAFFEQKGLKYDADMVLNKLVQCGILSENQGMVLFKYRCFEEYFFANMLRADKKELDYVISDRKFIFFARELELLSGLRRQNTDIIDVISREIENGTPPELNAISLERFDRITRSESGVALTRKRLSEIRKTKLTTDQIDDLMDEAERRAAQRVPARLQATPGDGRNPNFPSVSTDSPTVVSGGEGAAAGTPMSVEAFMPSVSLLGLVVRNSEFTDVVEKLTATQLYLRSILKLTVLFIDAVAPIIQSLSESKDDKRPTFNKDQVEIVKYLVSIAFVLYFSMLSSDQIGSEKMFTTLECIQEDPEASLAEKAIIATIMLDYWHSDWLKIWTSLIQEAKGRRFILEILYNRLWYHMRTRVLSATERKLVETAAARLARVLGSPKSSKSDVIKDIQQTTRSLARIEDAE